MATCRPFAVAILLGSLLGLPAGPALAGSDGADANPLAGRKEPALTLPTDPAGEKMLGAVGDYVKQQAWAQATRLLQTVLDSPDAFVPAADAMGAPRWTTLHAEADRRLATLPAAGRTFYQLAQGGRASALLAEAKEKGDPQLLADVCQRYLHTTAGAEAARLLGTFHLDRGRYALAAVCFERLLGLPDADKLPPSTLFTALVAFQQAGAKSRAGQIWERLTMRSPEGLQVGGKRMSLAAAKTWLNTDRRPVEEPSAFSEVVAEVKWRHATVHEAAAREWVQEAVRQQEARGDPVLPAFVPVVAGGKVVYRSHRGVKAVDLRTGELLWEFQAEGGLDTLSRELTSFPYVESWVNAHLQHNPHVLFGNSVVGSLGTDGERVYAVDDLAVPPFQNTYSVRGRPLAALEFAFGPGLSEAAWHNRLAALDLASGKLLWERGGPGTKKRKDELYPSFFLGPPLPVAGRLYALVEKGQELRLLCLDPASGDVLWTLPLGVVPAGILREPGRRVQALQLAYAEGILTCPTGLGFLFGIDPLARTFLWAYPYREAGPASEPNLPGGRGGWRGQLTPTPSPPPAMRSSWADPSPLLHDGIVIFTAPDDASIHCLNLRDGTPRWKAPQADGDLYVAGVSRGKVVLAGKEDCRALDLASGKKLWEASTWLPSGLGRIRDGVFYLPVQAAAEDEQPAVCALDVDSGRVRIQPMPAAKEVPGNLLFLPDMVLSQTAEAITAYPRHAPRKPDGRGP